MNWELFWSAFGAIGTTVESLAIAIAVIVALWQIKYTTKKKLKLIFNDDIKVYNPHSNEVIADYIGVTIINIGNRDVIISDWSILINNSKKRYKIMTELQGILEVKLPHKLEIETVLELSYEREFFLNVINSKIDKQEIKKMKN